MLPAQYESSDVGVTKEHCALLMQHKQKLGREWSIDGCMQILLWNAIVNESTTKAEFLNEVRQYAQDAGISSQSLEFTKLCDEGEDQWRSVTEDLGWFKNEQQSRLLILEQWAKYQPPCFGKLRAVDQDVDPDWWTATGGIEDTELNSDNDQDFGEY